MAPRATAVAAQGKVEAVTFAAIASNLGGTFYHAQGVSSGTSKAMSPDCGRMQKVDPPIQALVLLWCRLPNPKEDLRFGSAQGSGKGVLCGYHGVGLIAGS